MEKPKQGYFTSVQFLRGIAAFMVVLCHSPKGFEKLHPQFTAILDPLGAGVFTFLVISGFIIPFSMYKNGYVLGDFKQFMLRRIVRLEPPYIISIIMVLLLNYANTFYPWYHGPAYSVPWGLTLRHLAYINTFTGEHWLQWVYWTLAVEFQFYLMLSVIFPLLTNPNKKILFTTFFTLLACAFIKIPNRHYFIFSYLVFFLMGIALFLYMTDKIKTKEFFILLIPTYVVFNIVHTDIFHAPIDHIFTLATLPCIYYIKNVPKPFLWLGTISYSMYLTHMVLTSRFIVLFEKYLHLNFYVAWVLCVICCVIFAYLFYLAFEKPFLALSKKVVIHKKAN